MIIIASRNTVFMAVFCVLEIVYALNFVVLELRVIETPIPTWEIYHHYRLRYAVCVRDFVGPRNSIEKQSCACDRIILGSSLPMTICNATSLESSLEKIASVGRGKIVNSPRGSNSRISDNK
ncbi:hypothetical protein L1987_28086 [Smallanthus sonchifolius]|uniref:Uncharacterized protein n=1 Tax=Smallanthus sonchifolius TaxID=185202 RepID=A0ACB9IC33_9ASTR|nr:hypothetical protein L1987_28086 [Smallanthus sonchifolius]